MIIQNQDTPATTPKLTRSLSTRIRTLTPNTAETDLPRRPKKHLAEHAREARNLPANHPFPSSPTYSPATSITPAARLAGPLTCLAAILGCHEFFAGAQKSSKITTTLSLPPDSSKAQRTLPAKKAPKASTSPAAAQTHGTDTHPTGTAPLEGERSPQRPSPSLPPYSTKKTTSWIEHSPKKASAPS